MLLATFFLFLGLIIGSFLNVVVLRLESGKSLGGRSLCPSCGTLIHWYDNIPVLSYFLLGRQCRSCHYPIHWQYPAVELITGVLFALFGSIAYGLGSRPEVMTTVWMLCLVALFIAIAVYDVRNMEIPLVLLLVGIAGTVIYMIAMTVVAPIAWTDPMAPWREMMWGGGVGAAVFYALVYFSRETWMGMGDVWLAGIAGAAVGFPALLFLLTVSFSIGALVGVVLMLLGKRGMKSQIPFAPFLVAGTFVVIVVEQYHPWWLTLFLFPAV